MDKLFARIAAATGSILAFFLALFSIFIWTMLGFYFGWTETYLMIGTLFMSVISYLIPFIIQHSQNIDGVAIQRKLDEIIRAIDNADNKYRGIEKLTEKELKQIEQEE